MPVGKPTDAGEIVLGSRHSTRHGTLGTVAIWDCPACGMKNEGRRVEQGCGYCRAADPSKSRAGRPPQQEPVTRDVSDASVDAPGLSAGSSIPHRSPPVLSAAEAPLRVLRLIEYLIKPGKEADLTLRRSLIGRMEFGWGTLTGTIVDSIDERQADLLRLAHRQPGVWLANEGAMKAQDARAPVTEHSRDTSTYTTPEPHLSSPPTGFSMDEHAPPDTGLRYNEFQWEMARAITRTCGIKVAYTVALALSSIAEELAGNSEPEKFLTREECLQMANALMQTVPKDWQGDVPVEEEGLNATDHQS